MQADIQTHIAERVTPGTTFAEKLKGQPKTKDSEQETSQNSHRQQKTTSNNDQKEQNHTEEIIGSKIEEMIVRMMNKMDKMLDLLITIVTKTLNVQSP